MKIHRDAGPAGANSAAAALLVRDVADGDVGAFAELYDLFADTVYRDTKIALLDPTLAEQASEEVFLRVWRTATRYDPRTATVAEWIATLTHLESVTRRRPGLDRRPRCAALSSYGSTTR